ncbi:MAG: hypothetical protein HY784_15855 [Chloroflexi bacterium]|nr:hypothetical protein [Chloroflexota bacterium]
MSAKPPSTRPSAEAARQLRQRAVVLAAALLVAGAATVAALVLGQRASQNVRQAEARASTAQAASTQLVGQQATREALSRQQSQAAQQQARIAVARELAAAAIGSLETDPERGVLLALQAVSATYTTDHTWTEEAEEALRQALEAAGTSPRSNLRIEDLVALAQSRVTRSLTAEECQKYLHTEPCPGN